MNKRIIFLLTFLPCSGMSLFAKDTMLDAIEKLNVERALILADSSVKMSGQEKEQYVKAAQNKIDDAQLKLVDRYSRSDLIRLGVGFSSLAFTAIPAFLFFYYLPEVSGLLRGDDDAELITALLGVPLPGLATVLGATFGSLEVYKGLTQYDRRKTLNKAHAIAALIKRAKTSEPVRRVDRSLFEQEIEL
jgi:hypothetical protein